MKAPRRKLTEAEQSHAQRLLWGSTEGLLAKLLGVSERSLNNTLNHNGTMLESKIEKLTATKPEEVPKKKPRPKPTRSSKVFIPPSGLSYYREES